jgi:hypothetical protein
LNGATLRNRHRASSRLLVIVPFRSADLLFIDSKAVLTDCQDKRAALSKGADVFTVREQQAMTALHAVEDMTSARSGITRHQWLALWSGFLGWLFDSMDLNLFTLVLFPSVADPLHSSHPGEVARIGRYIMAIKLFCWGIGGILFGVVADHVGRERTMVPQPRSRRFSHQTCVAGPSSARWSHPP